MNPWKTLVMAAVLVLLPVPAQSVPGAQSDSPSTAMDADARRGVSPTTIAPARDTPQFALPLYGEGAEYVTKHGARVRFTNSAWRFVGLTLRDMFKTWTPPGTVGGFNLLLDPGYDFDTATAGPLRNTPLQVGWARYREQNSSLCCVNTRYHCAETGYQSDYDNWQYEWTQSRDPFQTKCLDDDTQTYGAITTRYNQRGVRPPFKSTSPSPSMLFEEHAFYVQKDPDTCFNQFTFCVANSTRDIERPDRHSGGTCTLDSQWTFEFNIRLMIFPTSYIMNQGTPVGNYTPPERWNYSGFDGNRIDHWETRSGHSGCSWCSRTGSCSVNLRSHAGSLPTPQTYNPMSYVGHRYLGTYVRSLDDTAVYLNYPEMQIQYRNYDGSSPAGDKGDTCGFERVYRGTGGYPSNYSPSDSYFTAQSPQCMRPLMYWNTDPNLGAVNQWQTCDPFDTWNADGTHNEHNDDGQLLWPGNDPSTVCEPVPCTVYDEYGRFDPNANCSGPLHQQRTANPFHTVPGAGWYGLKVNYLRLLSDENPNAPNSIAVELEGNDLRLEIGTWIDARGVGGIVSERRHFFQGAVAIDTLRVSARLSLRSIDDASCGEAHGGCGTPWQPYSDGKNSPDKLLIDIEIDPDTDIYISNLRPMGDDTEIFLGLRVSNILSLLEGTLIGIIQGEIGPMLEEELQFLAGAVPNLNSLLGDPIRLGNAMLEPGIYATPEWAASAAGGSNREWPVWIRDYSDGTAFRPGEGGCSNPEGCGGIRQAVDLGLALGFKPLAFMGDGDPRLGGLVTQDPAGTPVWHPDPSDPPAETSFFAQPTLYNPFNASLCPNCSRFNDPELDQYPHRDEDQSRDADDWVMSGSWEDPIVGTVQAPRVIPEYFGGQLVEGVNRQYSWCTTPSDLTAGGAAALRQLYPQETWLSFDPDYDTPPGTLSSSGHAWRNPASDNLDVTIGSWDQIPPPPAGYGVMRQNQNDPDVRITDPVPYDFSFHVHQSVLAQFVNAALAGGVGCLELAAEDENGVTPWADLLRAERFAAFIPEITRLFPGSSARIRIVPTSPARLRTGMGTFTYIPQASPDGYQAAPMVEEPYLFSLALPDVMVQFLVDVEESAEPIPLLTFNWNPVVGIYARPIRNCHPLDPEYGSRPCTSQQANVRTISGYYQLYFSLGHGFETDTGKSTWTNLGQVWDESPIDGFPAGKFTRREFGVKGSEPAIFEMVQTPGSYLCSVNDPSAPCDKLGLAQIVPTLLSSAINLYVTTRLSFADFTFDFLYVGPDGPNDDGVGYFNPGSVAEGTFGKGGGDYLGIYMNFIGALDVLTLINSLDGMFAPGQSIQPLASIPSSGTKLFSNSRAPVIDVDLRPSGASSEAYVSYSYRVNDGLWHPPSGSGKLSLPPLPEGEHRVEVKAIEENPAGAFAQLTPTRLTVVVDTLPPEVMILPSERGAYRNHVRIHASDLQTPEERLLVEYAVDDADWRPLEGRTLSIRHLSEGTYRLSVRATDEAGNTGVTTREIVVGSSPWSCTASGGEFPSWLVLLMILSYWLRRGRVR